MQRTSDRAKISILIPSKNRIELLKKAVWSVLAQDDPDFEIIISDNCSSDDYRSYVESLNDPRIIYHRNDAPLTVTDNWRKALDLSSGAYILMLGDDDALAPNFSKAVREYTDDPEGPEVIYLAAYHYAYPKVLPNQPRGYLASVKNAEFLENSEGAFCLASDYAVELAQSVLKFHYRVGLNAQHFVLRRSLIERCKTFGGIYQSPYPDTFAGVATLVGSKEIVVISDPTIIIGISPRSFGAYYFSGRHDEGYEFLRNESVDGEVRAELKDVVLPGDANNTNWLVAAEVARRRVEPAVGVPVDVNRYRVVQMLATLRSHYVDHQDAGARLDELKRRLTPSETTMFEIIEGALVESKSVREMTRLLNRMSKKIEQYAPAKVEHLDIGHHNNISDAVSWLAAGRGRKSFSLAKLRSALALAR